jgi:hypothetical protein
MTYNEAKIKADKQLQEDKEYLKHCLERNKPHNGLWWGFDESVLSVARILERYGQLSTASEAIDYFEKPYNFEDKMRFVIEEIK